MKYLNQNNMTADEILQKHEDANEMHFHRVDRKWIIEAMEEYASLSKKEIVEISDEEIIIQSKSLYVNEVEDYEEGFIDGAQWYRKQIKQK